MTLTGTTLVAPLRLPEAPLDGPHRPSLKRIVGRLALSLSVACVIPALLFYATMVTVNISAAVLVALGWSYGAIGWRWATKRCPSGLLALTAAIMTVRSVLALATGDSFIYFFQPVVSDVVVAAVFLLSLATARPIVSRLAADFYPMTHDIASRPRIRRLLWRLTLMWGVVCLVRSAVSFWLLESQTVVNFVVIKNISMISMTLLATVATVAAAAFVARQEGLLPAT